MKLKSLKERTQSLMKFEHTETYGWEAAIRGMRNPLESWAKSDSTFDIVGSKAFKLGKNDLGLMQRLIKAGPEHRKFLRQLFVSVDITAALYWWKEQSTYKIGTTENSTSTMHKLASKPITIDCFEIDDFNPDISIGQVSTMLGFLEALRTKYIETKDKRYWKELVRWLPESWLQTRTFTANYEVIYNMVHQRYNHKLNEWSGKDDPSKPNFIAWARTLPYAKQLIFWDLDEE